jgi:lipopolysaccharide biosynthesis glycosyltransferase
MIHITTAANENYAPGLLVTVASILSSINPDVELTLHFLNGGISPVTMGKLKQMCSTLHAHCTLVDIPLDESLFAGANLGPGNSYMAYARLLMGSLIQAPKVIYIDSDMVILKDLGIIWNQGMDGRTLLAVDDRAGMKLSDDCPLPLPDSEKSIPYFNSGFLVVDLDSWRRQGIEPQALEIAAEHKCAYWDQTILNYLFRIDSGRLARENNWQIYHVESKGGIVNANLHFIEKLKPWFYLGSNLKHRIWRLYYSRYVGSLLSLYASKKGIKGVFLGLKERLVRYSPIFRRIYFHYLRRRDDGTGAAEGIIKYYGNDSLRIPFWQERTIFGKFRKSHFRSQINHR